MVTIKCGDRAWQNIQAIIFDKDGTLENSYNFLRELGITRARLIDAQIPGIGEPLLMAFGIDKNLLDPTGLMAVGSRQENEIAAAAYIAETGCSWFKSKQIAANAFVEADQYCKKTAVNAPMFIGSLEIIKLLSKAGFKLGILSADSTAKVEEFVKAHQLSDYIQLAMGAERGLTKPAPELFIQACQRLEVEPNFTVMIGDSQGDIMMAQAAGAAGTIGIAWNASDATHLAEADVAIANWEQIQVLH